MTSEKKPFPSRILIPVLGAVGLILVALIVKGQLGQHADHAKKHSSIASQDSAPGTLGDQGSTTANAQNAPRGAAPTALAAAAAIPHNIDTTTYVNQRYPNQVTPQVVMLPPFTEEDKERKAREMFPEYARMQAQADAERARLGIKAE